MAIEIREMIIRAIIGNESKEDKNRTVFQKKKKEKSSQLADDMAKLLQQTQER
jgi:hypothetical protein